MSLKTIALPRYVLEDPAFSSVISDTSAIISCYAWFDGLPLKLEHLNIEYRKIPFLRCMFMEEEKSFTYPDEELYGAVRGKTVKAISDADADEIISFVDNCIAIGVDRFVVHCSAGVSRSPSIALALHEIYGAKLPKDFYETGLPKPHIVAALKASYGRKHGQIC